jgi:hypothetical protein
MGKYKGNCKFCVIYGHRGSECQKKAGNKRGEGEGKTTSNQAGANNSGNFPFACYRCHQRGHIAQSCPKRKKNEAVNLSQDNKIALIGKERGEIGPNLWIGGSGATSHITCCEVGMFDIKPSSHKITVGDGRHLRVEKTGKLRICFEGREKETTEVLLENMKFVPEIKVNLFSLTVALEKGASFYSEGTSVKHIYFDTKIKMGSSFLVAAKSLTNERTLINSEKKEMKLEKIHQMLDHPSIEMTRQTAGRRA